MNYKQIEKIKNINEIVKPHWGTPKSDILWFSLRLSENESFMAFKWTFFVFSCLFAAIWTVIDLFYSVWRLKHTDSKKK